MPINVGKLTVSITVVIDEPALKRCRDRLHAELDTPGADPVLVHEVVEQIMESAPVICYVMA